MAPSNLYEAADGPVMIVAGNGRHWRNLCEAIGRPDLVEHEDFATGKARVANVDKVDRIISDWCRTRKAADIIDDLNRRGIPCATVTDVGQVADAPHARERGG